MPNMSITSVETSNDGEIRISSDSQSPVPNEIRFYGSNLQSATSVNLDSGSGYTWVVSSISASANSIIVTAYVFGSQDGMGGLSSYVHSSSQTATGPTIEVYFAFPLID